MKKIIALLLVLSMLFALTACGGDYEPISTDESTGETTGTTESTNTTDGTEDSTQGTTEGTTGGDATDSTTPPTTTPPTTTPPTTTPPTTPPTTEAPHTHSYSAATCIAPAKCSCGATNGSALGHNFAAATCTAPKTCKTCGATEGNAAGHSWINATYTNPKTCSICQATEGSALTRESKAVTITMDNWTEYFEIIEYPVWLKNDFGEVDDLALWWGIRVKKEYRNQIDTSKASDVILAISGKYQLVGFEFNTSTQEYKYIESAKPYETPVDTSTTTTYHFPNDLSDNSSFLRVWSSGVGKVELPGQPEYDIYKYFDLSITRVQGSIYLFT